jgi:hypothetical protein
MFAPMIRLKHAFQCPITGKEFEFSTPKEKRLARHAQQAFTSDLIIELDGEYANGIRRPILFYHDEFNRRLRAKECARVAASAA